MGYGKKNFDKDLRLLKGTEQYLKDKSKAGRSSSTAGQPRPYAKKTMLKARLYSPVLVGQSVTVVPLHDVYGLVKGRPYEWKVVEPGLGYIGGQLLGAEEINNLFKYVPKSKV